MKYSFLPQTEAIFDSKFDIYLEFWYNPETKNFKMAEISCITLIIEL